MNICEHLFVTAKLFPDKEAVVFQGQRFTYAQLASMTAAAAEQLSAAGIERGDRVAIMLPNVPAFIVCCLLYTSPSPRDRTRSRMPSSA